MESLPQPSQKDQQGALVVQDQEGGEQAEEDFISQVLQCARKEWKSFRLQHADINEEIFVEAERFCIKQWLIQQGITLANLPAFEQAEEQFARELEQHAGEIEASAQKMESSIFTEAQFLGVSIATQARQRSKQAREAIQVSGNTYLTNKISTLRAREREQAAQQRQEDVRQGTKDLKALGITIVYENQKEALEEREQAFREHMSTLAHLIEENPHRIDATRYIATFEKYLKNIDILLKDLRLKTVDTYRVQGAGGMVSSDWDAARQRAMHIRTQAKTLQEVITAIQAGTEDALTRAKAEGEHIQKVKQTLERVRKRRAEIETWADAEKEQAEEIKKDSKDVKDLAERFSQANFISSLIKIQNKLIFSIDEVRSKTNEFVKQLESIYTSLKVTKMCFMNISEKGVKLTITLEKARQALEQAIRVAKSSITDIQEAFDQQSGTGVLPDQADDATQAQVRARQAAREEMQAYAQAKQYAGAALRYLRDISAEYSKVEETSDMMMNAFTDLLESSLPFEKAILDQALTGVKQIVKVSMNVLKLEEQAKEAAHQLASEVETGQDTDISQLLAKEQEALVLVALANDALVGYAASYYTSHTVAAHVIREQLETSVDAHTEEFTLALQEIKKDLDAIHQQRKSQQAQRQAAIPSDALRQAHLLIDERTGALTLKDGQATFHLQDLAQITQASAEESPGRSRLIFRAGHPCSSYDVPHEQLHQGCEGRTRIHLQVPDAAGGQVAMLFLPNGTPIKLADIDLEQTIYDPARPQRGVTITLKQHESSSKGAQQINLLAATGVMRSSFTPDTLRKLMDSHQTQILQHLTSALETQDVGTIQDIFRRVKSDTVRLKYIEKYLLTSKEQEKRKQDYEEWTGGILQAAHHAAMIVREQAEAVVNAEKGEKEITEQIVIEKAFLDDDPDETYRKRDDCLREIITARGLDAILACELFQDPDNSSAGTYPNPTVQEVLIEYERAISWHLAEQQEKNPSDKWARYLARLRRAILDEAPASVRARFLFSQIEGAIQADDWEEGTADRPGLARLAKELEAIGQPDPHGNNDYANALHILTGRAIAGIQDALTRGDASSILAKLNFLEKIFHTLSSMEASVEDALQRTTPTAMARDLLEKIGSARQFERTERSKVCLF